MSIQVKRLFFGESGPVTVHESSIGRIKIRNKETGQSVILDPMLIPDLVDILVEFQNRRRNNL